MLDFLTRLLNVTRVRKKPDIKVVKVTEGMAYSPLWGESGAVVVKPFPAEQILPAEQIPVTARVAEGARFDMVGSPQTPGAYMIGLEGEQHYPMAVAALKPGAPISLELEPGNPDDSCAIAAVDGKGRIIGYIGQESWLREAVYGSGAGFSARVLAAEMGTRGFREVVLEIEVSETPLRERHYQPRQPQLL